MKLQILLFIAISVSLFFNAELNQTLAEPKGTGLLNVQIGQSRTGEELSQLIDKGNAYRVKLFGGMKLDLEFIGAAGLGLDLTAHTHKLKEGFTGRYNRLTWDWFYLPVKFGLLTITPGLGWSVIDVKISEMDIKEISIRPHAMLNLGLSLAIAQHVALTADVRYESIWEDREPSSISDEVNVTDSHFSSFVGLMTYF